MANPVRKGPSSKPFTSFDPVDLRRLAEVLKNLVALGEGTPVEKATAIMNEMRRLDADEDIETFVSWFAGEDWDSE